MTRKALFMIAAAAVSLETISELSDIVKKYDFDDREVAAQALNEK